MVKVTEITFFSSIIISLFEFIEAQVQKIYVISLADWDHKQIAVVPHQEHVFLNKNWKSCCKLSGGDIVTML